MYWYDEVVAPVIRTSRGVHPMPIEDNIKHFIQHANGANPGAISYKPMTHYSKTGCKVCLFEFHIDDTVITDSDERTEIKDHLRRCMGMFQPVIKTATEAKTIVDAYTNSTWTVDSDHIVEPV